MHELPIRFIVGYLPGVEKRDARAFAQGFIERHFEGLDESGWHVMPHAEGWLYELHEGGIGKALLPSILQTLEATDQSVFIQTATRLVRVDRQDAGLTSLMMPEDLLTEPTEGILPSHNLTPARGDGKGWAYAGGLLMLAGLVALGLAAAVHQGARVMYEAALDVENPQHTLGTLVRLAKLSVPESPAILPEALVSDLPIGQRKRLTAGPGEYLEALRYQKGRWVVDVKKISDEPAAPTLVADPAPVPGPDLPPAPSSAEPAPPVAADGIVPRAE